MSLSLFSFHWQITWDGKWTIWCGYVLLENSCLYIFTGTVIWLMSHFLTADNRPGFQWNVNTYGGGVIYIFCSFVCDLYTVLLTSMTAEHNHRCYQKDRFCLFISFKSRCLKSVHSGQKSKAIILHDRCDWLGLNFASSCVWLLPTYFEDRKMLEHVGINSR